MKNNKNAFLKYDEKLKIISFYLTTESHKRSNEKSKKITKVHRRAKKFSKITWLNDFKPVCWTREKKRIPYNISQKLHFLFPGGGVEGGKKLTPLACMHYTRIGVLKTIYKQRENGRALQDLNWGEVLRERQKKTCIVVLMYTLQYNTCSYQFIKPTFCSINRYLQHIFQIYTFFLSFFFCFITPTHDWSKFK